MKVLAKSNGTTTEHEIPREVMCLVTDNGIKVEAPDAYTITATDTIKCMADMNQKAWEHISTGPLFKHFFDTLFQQRPVTLPESIKVLNEDYDEGGGSCLRADHSVGGVALQWGASGLPQATRNPPTPGCLSDAHDGHLRHPEAPRA